MTAARITLDAAALEELRGRTFLPGPVTTDRLVEQSRAALDLRDRVATLEAELAAANELADGYRLAVDDSDHRGMGWMAHANALRDALEKANAAFNAWGRDEDGIHPEAWPAVEHLREVLLATPAASLAALRRSSDRP